ncbi:hypothetical protein EMIT036CA2_20217 [Chryseobacterium sp. IT-36CA2]
MNFFISHKDRKGFVKCEMYKTKCVNKELMENFSKQNLICKNQ